MLRTRSYLGRRLRRWRLSQELTQTEAHKRLWFDGEPWRAGRLEAGELPWQRHEVEPLAGAVKVEVHELLRASRG